MLVDYGRLTALLTPIIEERLDHHYLNDTISDNPTSEHVARWLWEWLGPLVEKIDGCWLSAVEIDETCTASCRVT